MTAPGLPFGVSCHGSLIGLYPNPCEEATPVSHATLPRARPGSRGRAGIGPVRRAIRGFGELLLTLGLVVLLFVCYELFVTNWLTAMKQHDATVELHRQWARPGAGAPLSQPMTVPQGEPFGRMYIPEFGADWSYTLLQGTSQANLEVGPGHYIGTAWPGRPGNFALAGHRVGTGSPFLNLDDLESCDALVIETARAWIVYRVLPMADEDAGWAQGRGRLPQCQGVAPLPPPYQHVPGRLIVEPSQTEVLATVPGKPNVTLPPAQRQELITLTTCHPKFTALQRMIIHGVMTAIYRKPSPPPPVLQRMPGWGS